MTDKTCGTCEHWRLGKCEQTDEYMHYYGSCSLWALVVDSAARCAELEKERSELARKISWISRLAVPWTERRGQP